MYRVTIDKDACEGIFACLVRDDRFVEAEDGLAGFDPDAATEIRETDGSVVADFDDDRLDRARQAAEACPPSAITVAEIDESDRPSEEAEACR
ncbi:MAG: ferredoxin [Haloarculaceae archaeon]|jgi:ferredoxin